MNSKRSLEFLKNNRLATIATMSLEGNPQASLIYYVTDDNFHIYMVTSTESRKIKNIFRKNKVALVIGQEVEPIVLQIEGEAKIVDDQDKKKEIANRYLKLANESNPKSINWPPIRKIPSESGFIIVEIMITWFKFSDFSKTESLIIEGISESDILK
ncbi:hypothetical protein A3C59_02880 [Candidatus Daviesbacteria bacterium RIFCSPHIGHO2_02_FULL_36_13]|uniref:Pyridoxamine 5'-phosphate oxidase N-terminal domain-containing protein n=1 Tax=Candidatus Daviesbacteria bacterium RIFCSPHIGHO2_02_FULL_36_13 TaxID=1797768 RepID=A0A1F5JWW7_9BACT|nr:MAG: hypothetical protein A3C59_02880 [Candidatus Daviesbacteria bacterium RIFCSPHIGHO2_02_FULL_36_13]